ncbi:MAG: ABC transporter permease [Coriobacteriia bacterium]|nr:ABC transporter permease [Coriobacteriia bacterium]
MRFNSILWKEWMVFKNRFLSTTLGAVIGPLLYLIAFGWGIGSAVQVDGVSYTAFVIPGIVALNSMTNSYSWVANDINLSRIYAKTFEAVMVAPIKMSVYAFTRISTSAFRGLYSALLILLIAFAFQIPLPLDWYFFLVLLLNCYVFATIGFIVGLLVDSHADMAKISNFVITPMSFLCGTFFPLERFPIALRTAFNLLPLSQAVSGMRLGFTSLSSLFVPLVLLAYLIVLMPISIVICKRAE